MCGNAREGVGVAVARLPGDRRQARGEMDGMFAGAARDFEDQAFGRQDPAQHGEDRLPVARDRRCGEGIAGNTGVPVVLGHRRAFGSPSGSKGRSSRGDPRKDICDEALLRARRMFDRHSRDLGGNRRALRTREARSPGAAAIRVRLQGHQPEIQGADTDTGRRLRPDRVSGDRDVARPLGSGQGLAAGGSRGSDPRARGHGLRRRDPAHAGVRAPVPARQLHVRTRPIRTRSRPAAARFSRPESR